MNKRTTLFLLFLLTASFRQYALSQETASASVSSIDTSRIDTNYVKYYKDKLIIGLWQSERRFDIHINQKTFPKIDSSEINYIANSNQVSGIAIDYDIIGFAFGYKSVPGDVAKYGRSDYLDLGLNINARRIRLENSFKRYTGFYDNNSKYYDTTQYFKNPSMNLRVIKSKLIYQFNNKKFALGAVYANTKRQVRSKGSWLMVGNFYALNLHSDSSIIPAPQQLKYGYWSGFHKMNVYAFSAGFGGTYTLVLWKNLYLNLLYVFGLERQYRHYYVLPENNHHAYWKTWTAGDYRFSLGYNGRRFFWRTSGIYDLNNYESKNLKFDMKFISGSVDFGYRFNFRAPKPYRKFQETNLYKMM